MWKACAKCGKIHPYNTRCYVGVRNRKKNTNANKFRRTQGWTNKSIEIRERSNYLCSVCLDNNIYNYRRLEVHHITPLEEDTERGLDNLNLICLCNMHHREAEEGKIEREYLYRLAEEREMKSPL